MNMRRYAVSFILILVAGLFVVAGLLFYTQAHASSLTINTFANGTPPPHTTSWYKTTLSSATMQREGCAAAKGATGLVILDYGEPYSRNGTYGALLTQSNTFAADTDIQANVIDFLRGVNSCSTASTNLKVAPGTSNDNSEGLSTSQLNAAGQAWGQLVNATADYIHANTHVTMVGADDIETGYSTFAEAKAFVDGFNAKTSALFVDYGDDPDGANGDGSAHSWTAQQMWYFTSGDHGKVALPEIYYSANAAEWVQLSAWACNQFGKPVDIFGTMAQNGFQSSLGADQAWQTMYNALKQSSNSCVQSSVNHLYYSTNILS